MDHDPQGYYAKLEVDHDAGTPAIHMAFRRKARVLHPDIPVTGNTAAFVAIKEAYDVLSDPLRRAAYDRAARALPEPQVAQGFRRRPSHEAPPAPHWSQPPATPRGPRLSDLPIVIWAGVGILVLVAGVEAVLHLKAAPTVATAPRMQATAPSVPSQPAQRPTLPLRLVGETNAYVTPAGNPAVVFRHDDTRDAFVSIAQLPPFSAVQALRLNKPSGMMEIRLNDTLNGFIDVSRLMPGNIVAAQRAYCAYNAGPPPANAEVLGRAGTGAAEVTIENRTGQPLVVKLRNNFGLAAATVFVSPDSAAHVGGLPAGDYQPDYAFGELWSRGCNTFAGGMRAQRFRAHVEISTGLVLTIPPDLMGQGQPTDISDTAFGHE